MINVLFSPSEIRKLKEHINKQKFYSENVGNKEEIEKLNGLYKALYDIERKNAKRN